VPLIRKLRTFRSLDAAGRLMIVEALALPLCISLGFWVSGVPRTQARLRKWALAGKTTGLPADSERQILKACQAQRIVKRSTGVAGNCLVRSLTLWTLLLRRGVSTDLRVGFRKRDGRFEGHAWVEHAGAPINEDANETKTFVPWSEPFSYDLWRRVDRNDSAA
jgi:Transglutaminase-like superfamily